MKFIDIILVLSVSAVASALVATPNAETRSHQLSKRSPGKDWKKLVEGNPNDDGESKPGPSNNNDSSEPGPSNSDSAKNELDDTTRQRKKACNKYHKYKKEFQKDPLGSSMKDAGFLWPWPYKTHDYNSIDSSIEKAHKKMKELKKECDEATEKENHLRQKRKDGSQKEKEKETKEAEKQSDIKSGGKLKRFKSMLDSF
ncbi:hypothetical protein RTP6_006930 [Batrachochytrium dendrobatidis]